MISGKAHIENEIEVNDNLSDAMSKIAGIMHESIIAGLEAGGNPTFHPLGSGAPSYLGGRGGSIAQSMGHASTDTTAEAGVFDVLPYSYIHNFGGQIKVTERQKAFFWFMYKQTGEQMWKALALKYQPGEFIQMPKREYIHFTDDLTKDIMDILKTQILTFKQGGRVVN
jgi:phage gpG-like protein